MDYITKNINSFTKRLAEAINGRQINAPKSNPSSKKITWNWGGTFYPNAPKSGIRVRRSLGINGAIVESGSWLYRKTDWIKFDQVIKKDGYWWHHFKYQAPGSSNKHFY